ncbi:sugar phosphate isomerase/epimerase [Candidatus Woesearchaeota archaeon]|nr:sugar phosphate isomerase/epimerase [Candidatus Woesearchaeota archaeon]
MKIGIMNWPKKSVYEEIEWIGKHKFDFVDLSLEPPGADVNKIEIKKIKNLLKKYKLGIVGHSAWYVQTNCPIKGVRTAILDYFMRCLDVFSKLGAKVMTVHSLSGIGDYSTEDIVDFYAEVLNPLCKEAKKKDMYIVIENMGSKRNIKLVKYLLKKIPLLRFHLDLGHANCFDDNMAEEFLRRFGKKLMHVHASDNFGTDLHLPIGTGNIDWVEMVRLLKNYKYDGTITLEVFSPDLDYKLISREKLKKIWDEL